MREKEIRGLMEAYSNVYVSEENEIQEWANSLIEEGYDLTEYTSDELYEAYIEEQGGMERLSPSKRKAAIAAAGERRMQQNVQRAQAPTPPTRPGRGSSSRYQAVQRDRDAGGNAAYRAGGGDAAARGGLTRQQIQQKGMSAVKSAPKPATTPATTPTAPKPAATSAPKPAATSAPKPAAAKPAATSAAKPASPAKPATGMLGKTSFERRTPTSAELKGAQAARASGASPEKALQAAKSAGGALSQATAAASKPTAFNPSANASASSAAKPSTPVNKATGSKKPGSIVSSADLFDIVKGHLLDEGYADSEEGAMVIMVNMSDEWRTSILESCGVQLDEAQRARENPEEYERSSEAREGRRRRSGINDPNTGINSPAFQAFMAKQMGGKKKKED